MNFEIEDLESAVIDAKTNYEDMKAEVVFAEMNRDEAKSNLDEANGAQND